MRKVKLTLFTNFINLTGSEFKEVFGRELTQEDKEMGEDNVIVNTVKIDMGHFGLKPHEFIAVPYFAIPIELEKRIKPVLFNSPLGDRWVITDFSIYDNFLDKISRRFVEDEIEIPFDNLKMVNFKILDREFLNLTEEQLDSLFSLKDIKTKKIIENYQKSLNKMSDFN